MKLSKEMTPISSSTIDTCLSTSQGGVNTSPRLRVRSS
jgi:hypothetical protein